MFVAVARIPPGPAALRQAAAIAGLAAADVSRLLAGVLPRILVRATPAGARIAGELAAAGFAAFASEESAVLSDKQRVVARDLELSAQGFVAVDGHGERHDCPAASIAAFLRGIRIVETTEVVKTMERKLDLGKALLTSGLSVTRKVVTASERTSSAKEPFVLVQRADGGPDIMLYQSRLNYRCLARGLQPSAFQNLLALVARLRALAPEAPLDDRITRPGFLAGLPLMALDPVDLAVFLVERARSMGC